MMLLEVIQGTYAVCQMPTGGGDMRWINKSGFWSVTETDEEVSVICLDECLPERMSKESGWALIRVAGPLDFSLVGILSSILTPLAESGISVFTLSTFNTDYIMVKHTQLAQAVSVLAYSGYSIRGDD